MSFSRSNKNSHVVRHTEFLCEAVFFDFSKNSLILTSVANSHEKSADTEITTRCDVIFFSYDYSKLTSKTHKSKRKFPHISLHQHTTAIVVIVQRVGDNDQEGGAWGAIKKKERRELSEIRKICVFAKIVPLTFLVHTI